MDLKHVQAFVLVARHGSITSAAPELFLSPPALSQQLTQLETELGVRLMDRGPRGVALTEAGRVFLVDAQKLLEAGDAITQHVREVAQGETQVLRMGSITGMVPDFYPRLKSACRRQKEIRLEHVEDTEAKLLSALAEGRLDLMEYYDAPRLRRLKLMYVPLLREGRSCLMVPDHPLAERAALVPEDLAGRVLYAYQFDRVPGLAEYLEERYPDIRLEEGASYGGGYYDVLELCDRNGLCLIPTHCAEQFAPLVARPLELPFTWTSGLVCRRQHSPKVAWVIQLAQELYAHPHNAKKPED